MDTPTRPIPVVTFAPPLDPVIPPARSRSAIRPVLTASAVVAALVFLYFNWAAVLGVVLVAAAIGLALLIPIVLLLRLVFGSPGLTVGALLGAIATASLIRRR